MGGRLKVWNAADAAWEYVNAPGGGTQLVSCGLLLTAPMDIHAVATYPIKWNRLVDNLWDANTLTAIPAGLGLDFVFDGSSGLFTATEDGVWAYVCEGLFADADTETTIVGRLDEGFGYGSSSFNYLGDGVSIAAVFPMAAGTVGGFQANVRVGASQNPYHLNTNLQWTRLA